MNPATPSDPAIDEIREIRHRISASYDHDPARLVEYLMQYQEQFRDRLIYEPGMQSAARSGVQPDTDKAASSHPSASVGGR